MSELNLETLKSTLNEGFLSVFKSEKTEVDVSLLINKIVSTFEKVLDTSDSDDVDSVIDKSIDFIDDLSKILDSAEEKEDEPKLIIKSSRQILDRVGIQKPKHPDKKDKDKKDKEENKKLFDYMKEEVKKGKENVVDIVESLERLTRDVYQQSLSELLLEAKDPEASDDSLEKDESEDNKDKSDIEKDENEHNEEDVWNVRDLAPTVPPLLKSQRKTTSIYKNSKRRYENVFSSRTKEED